MYIEELKEILKKTFNKKGYELEVNITISNRPELCDYQCNDLFKLAKEYGKSPKEIGEEIALELNQQDDAFSKVEFCMPGFINLTLSNEFINKYLKLFSEDIKNSVKKVEKETVVIDYGGPNVAKPLHVGHMRTTNIGESIKRIIEFYGHKVISDVHLGDIGLQIGQVIYKMLEDKIDVNNLSIQYLDEVYPLMSKACKENDEIKEKCAQITKELQEGNELYTSLWKKICEVSVEDMKKSYKKLGTEFDYWYGESDAFKYLDETTKIMEPVLETSDGALVVDIKKETDKNELPPLIYKKSNGAYLYGSTDLATIYQRKKEFAAERIVYVTDLRQNLHFTQVFRASDKAGLFKINNLEHIGYGTANGEDNKPYKTRGGETPKLENLLNDAKDIFISKREDNKNLSEEDLNKITTAILKFADLQTMYEKDYVFDLNKFSDVNGKTGPYLIYTYLRINKIIGLEYNESAFTDNIYNETDRNLRLKLLEVGRILDLAYNERRPNIICEYVYNLSSNANIFYGNNHIINETNITKKDDWLFILKLTNKVIKEMLYLLGIEIPSQM